MMQRRDFLASSFGAILTAGLPMSAPAEWKVYYWAGDYVAARSRFEARAFFFEWLGEEPLPEPADLEEHAIARFEGAFFFDEETDAETSLPAWIRRMVAERPHTPCYLFSDSEVSR